MNFRLNDSYRHCKSVFKSVEEHIAHEVKCPIGKMISIQQAAITRNDIKVTCPYCTESDYEKKHVCKMRLGMLLYYLLRGTCSDWLKAYIMHEFVKVRPQSAAAGNNNNNEEYADLINEIITAAKHDDD